MIGPEIARRGHLSYFGAAWEPRGGRWTTFLCVSTLLIWVGPDGAAIMIWFRNSPTGPAAMIDFGTTRRTSRRSTNHLSERPEGPWGGEPRPSPQFMMWRSGSARRGKVQQWVPKRPDEVTGRKRFQKGQSSPRRMSPHNHKEYRDGPRGQDP